MFDIPVLCHMRILEKSEFELIFSLGTFIVCCWLICDCRYQTAKNNINVAFPVRVFCNTAIIIRSLLIPSFLTRSKSKLVESPMS